MSDWVELQQNSSTQIFVDNLENLTEDVNKIYMIIGTSDNYEQAVLTFKKMDRSEEWECIAIDALHSEGLNLENGYSDIWKITKGTLNGLSNEITYSTKDNTLTIGKVETIQDKINIKVNLNLSEDYIIEEIEIKNGKVIGQSKKTEEKYILVEPDSMYKEIIITINKGSESELQAKYKYNRDIKRWEQN